VRIPGTVAVLMYHSIAAATTASFEKLTVDPVLFCEHLAALGEHTEVIGFAQVPAALTEGLGRTGDDRWALPRLQVNGGTTPEELLAMVR
jgi:hypothetical protein